MGEITFKPSLISIIDSPFRTPISSAILQLQEGGQLHIIKEKWWKNKHGGGKCNKVSFSLINVQFSFFTIFRISWSWDRYFKIIILFLLGGGWRRSCRVGFDACRRCLCGAFDGDVTCLSCCFLWTLYWKAETTTSTYFGNLYRYESRYRGNKVLYFDKDCKLTLFPWF